MQSLNEAVKEFTEEDLENRRNDINDIEYQKHARQQITHICMKLVRIKGKQLVEDFMTNRGYIEIQGEIVRSRKLITPAGRIVPSNVSFSIPHEILINELQNIGLVPASPMTFLKISATLPEYNHILSFRRQIYISPHNLTLPESSLLEFDNTYHRIFISQDGLVCYNCQKPGHKASQCSESTVLEDQHSNNEKSLPSLCNAAS
uniref:Uncharacterized protein LOC114330876 n=1 Tax=Diabrotica virgifera virgifera TaxID=50390 RepID=A0A6P7FT55_DIAVI